MLYKHLEMEGRLHVKDGRYGTGIRREVGLRLGLGIASSSSSSSSSSLSPLGNDPSHKLVRGGRSWYRLQSKSSIGVLKALECAGCCIQILTSGVDSEVDCTCGTQ